MFFNFLEIYMYLFSSSPWCKTLAVGLGSLFLCSAMSPIALAMEDENAGITRGQPNHHAPRANSEDLPRNDTQARAFLERARAGGQDSLDHYQSALLYAQDPELRAEVLLGLARIRRGFVGGLHCEAAINCTSNPERRAQAYAVFREVDPQAYAVRQEVDAVRQALGQAPAPTSRNVTPHGGGKLHRKGKSRRVGKLLGASQV